MNRQAFEAWVRTVDKSLSLHKVPDGGYKYPRTKSAWSAYKAATNAALERAAEVCEKLGTATNGIYERNQECVDAIRTLRDES